ncbi:DUF4202 domain-containing protein [Thalassotalea ganghwensis]
MTDKLTAVLTAIDDLNAKDSNLVDVEGKKQPKELIYGQRMSACLNQYWPNADELLQIAVRAQHIMRWHIKRDEFPQGKKGYLDWRKALGQFHAQQATKIMLAHGYSQEQANITAAIIRKEQLKKNPQTQTLEDVACLVFLEHYFAAFAAKHNEDKIIRILQLTWRKMSAQGHKIALSLSLPEHLNKLVTKALS